MTDRVYNVLFLCKGNSARSIMAEAILRKLGAAHFCAYSAGFAPRGEVHPLAIKTLEGFECPTEGLRSKSWDEFTASSAPVMDFVFTVCDDTAQETNPDWPGHPMTAVWAIDDPVIVEGTAVQRERAFVETFKYLRTRISLFLALPLSSIGELALGAKLRDIAGAKEDENEHAGTES
jgi:arsenate reductase